MLSKFLLVFGSVALAAFATAAPADVRATYVDPERQKSLVVEIADDGAMRFTSDDGSYDLILDGRIYSVNAGPGGPIVITGEAVAFRIRQEFKNGTMGRFSDVGSAPRGPITYVPGAEVTVAGHEGVRYAVAGTGRQPVILSTDAALLPLGKAVAAYSRAVTMMSDDTDDDDNLPELLANHGVLGFWLGQLVTVTFDRIDRSRFVIPATPISLADVTAAAEAERATGANKVESRPSVIKALYRDHMLLTLTEDGRLHAWPEGAAAGERVKAPGWVRSFCAMDGELVLVTGRERERKISLWTGRSGAWSLATRFDQGAKDPFVALDCSGAEPVLLTARAIRLPRSGRSIAIKPEMLAPGGFFTTLQHGGYLYVGANAGEWGGGLRRFALAGGAAEVIDGADPDTLCGGTLDVACDPVTGLAPDPARPDCILATTGLEHFMSRGSVVRVCGGKISLAYAKPYTLDTAWRFDAQSKSDFSPTVAFYSLGTAGQGAWAVGSDGTYHFTHDDAPDFAAFPKDTPFPASGIDWSNRDFVLVATNINQRHSMSGISLILVPR